MPDFRAYIDGKTKSRDDGGCSYVTGSDGCPLAGGISIADRFFHCDGKGQPVALHVLYLVDDFGEVVLNTLPLPDTDDPYNLGIELGRAKLAQIEDRRQAWSANGFASSRRLRDEIERSKKLLHKAATMQADNPVQAASVAEKALTRLLWAGERLAIEAANHGIAKRKADGSAKQILLGANCFGLNGSAEYKKHFAKLFNYATLPFHWGSFEPEPGNEDWPKIQNMLDWLRPNNIKAKGHPLVWFFEPSYPNWARRGSFEELQQINADRVGRVVSRCSDEIASWCVITQAHDIDHANMFGLSQEQLLEMTAAAVRAARAANPRITTIISVCSPFGEYVSQKKDKLCPGRYLRACIDKGINFDAIGMQWYYGSGGHYCRDLLEISDRLDKFGDLGKPVHISEIGCPSSSKPDPHHMLGDATVQDAGEWHGKWCEALQAKWVEEFYTICCSKSFVEAVTWWDFADYPQHYFTHAGLLREDFSPKPAYHRLHDLARNLGIKQ
ncbi:MAG: endo-1,4-beta-xylanase [Planctomycetes bacterium]|nr:endo-1,4-beta-xylanase [Planctomycetota bacterium]